MLAGYGWVDWLDCYLTSTYLHFVLSVCFVLVVSYWVSFDIFCCKFITSCWLFYCIEVPVGIFDSKGAPHGCLFKEFQDPYLHLHLSHSLADHWGITLGFTTNFLHSLQFLAFPSMVFHSRAVHSLMLSSHHFLCLSLRLPPYTVPSRILLASPDDLVMCPYHFSVRLHWSQVFIRPDGVSNSGFHFLIGNVICVQDTKEFAKQISTK